MLICVACVLAPVPESEIAPKRDICPNNSDSVGILKQAVLLSLMCLSIKMKPAGHFQHPREKIMVICNLSYCFIDFHLAHLGTVFIKQL